MQLTVLRCGAAAVRWTSGAPERRREAQRKRGLLSEDCLSRFFCMASSAAALFREHHSGAPQGPPNGVCFLLPTYSLHKQRKVGRHSRRNHALRAGCCGSSANARFASFVFLKNFCSANRASRRARALCWLSGCSERPFRLSATSFFCMHKRGRQENAPLRRARPLPGRSPGRIATGNPLQPPAHPSGAHEKGPLRNAPYNKSGSNSPRSKDPFFAPLLSACEGDQTSTAFATLTPALRLRRS